MIREGHLNLNLVSIAAETILVKKEKHEEIQDPDQDLIINPLIDRKGSQNGLINHKIQAS